MLFLLDFMKHIARFLTIVCCSLVSAFNSTSIASNHILFRFSSRAEAQMLITNIDRFTNNWNQLDVNLRLNQKEGKKSQLLTVAMNATRGWSDAEKQKVTKAFTALENRIKKNKYSIPLPKEIILVKSTMAEEFNAEAYTRENWIALNETIIQKASEQDLQHLLAHELFHLASRTNHAFKKAIYETIGFHVADKEILFPADIVQKRISNPDVSQQDSYASLNINGNTINCAMIIYTEKELTNRSLNEIIEIGLVPLNEQLIPIQAEGKTIIYPLTAASDLKEKTGDNSSCYIHPEEIAADNFAFTLIGKTDLKTPEITANIKKILSSAQY